MPEAKKKAAKKKAKKKATKKTTTRKPRVKKASANHDADGNFAKGNTLGGPRPGSGRPRDVLRHQLREALAVEREILKSDGKTVMAKGSALELAVCNIYYVLADPEVDQASKMRAARLALEYCVGKPAVEIEVTDTADLSSVVLDEMAASHGVKQING